MKPIFWLTLCVWAFNVGYSSIEQKLPEPPKSESFAATTEEAQSVALSYKDVQIAQMQLQDTIREFNDKVGAVKLAHKWGEDVTWRPPSQQEPNGAFYRTPGKVMERPAEKKDEKPK